MPKVRITGLHPHDAHHSDEATIVGYEGHWKPFNDAHAPGAGGWPNGPVQGFYAGGCGPYRFHAVKFVVLPD